MVVQVFRHQGKVRGAVGLQNKYDVQCKFCNHSYMLDEVGRGGGGSGEGEVRGGRGVCGRIGRGKMFFPSIPEIPQSPLRLVGDAI